MDQMMRDKLAAAKAEIERLRAETGRLRAIVRVNLMRCEGATHEEIDRILGPIAHVSAPKDSPDAK
jgi:hypothetical protein